MEDRVAPREPGVGAGSSFNMVVPVSKSEIYLC